MPELLPTSSPTGTVVETARLRLRAYHDDDLVALAALANNWQVARWLKHLPFPYREAHGREWIAHVRQAHAAGRPRSFAIALKESDQLIGGGGIDGSAGSDSDAPGLGYWLGQPYWGQGYGREAVAAFVDYGFRVLGLEIIEAHTDPANAASQKILVACCLMRAGEISLAEPTRNGALYAPSFRMLREDWRAL